MLPITIKVRLSEDDRQREVLTGVYISAKTKALRDFGYTNLTEDTVKEQIEKILAGEKLSVIGMFIESDIVKE